MTKKKWAVASSLALSSMLVLAACGDEEETTNEGTDTEENTNEETDEGSTDIGSTLGTDTTNADEAIEGGTLKVALVAQSPFQGIFSWTLYEDGYDADLMEYTTNAIFETDGDFLATDEGIASMSVDEEAKVVTIKIREGVKWSDGEPLKIEDLMLPYEIIGHPDYTGVRYDADFKNIVGAEEYNAGTADTISGITKVDETTMTIALKEVSPAIASIGAGIWGYAEPSHIIKDIPVAELVEHDAVRLNPVTLGPFKINKIVPGESVEYVKNEHYWKGEPKLDGVVVKVVPSSSAAVALQNGEYDMAVGFGATQYDQIESLENIEILAREELAYTYLGFKLGKMDTEAGQVVMDPNAKMADKNLRKAMGYALNIEEVSDVYYYGLRSRANSFIPPVFASFHNADLPGYTYDPEKAMELLDEAGYVDKDGDGIREDKEGNPLEIRLATMSGDDIAEQITQYWLQNWADVGLNVTLTTGRSIEFNAFYDKVQADDPEIDIFMGAWGTGTNPSPMGLYSNDAAFNFSRFATEESQELLVAIDSPEAFDADFRKEKLLAWEELMAEEAPVIPMNNRLEITPVNKRVKNFSIDYTTDLGLEDVQLTAEEPIK
ncbi:oligopeptide ABC transporter substrate-binding protein [Caryophanon latum]|uniref:ABC transporter substrate-binding protein n=1 Tax=Caryophanon latum TaxID=33977 RepID=A0A1C0Z335_9BACL|nr:oligopeptide ABC transporter substrate-binding protein [Caryophanon latum]OCS93710.1 ABC transporter substrate-binding protein [Caryophanon latum]